MTVTVSRYVEPSIYEFLVKLNLTTCWLLDFKVITNPEAFFNNFILNKYDNLAIIVNERSKEKVREIVELAKDNWVSVLAFISDNLREEKFLLCVKSKIKIKNFTS
ncbi:hypothetical protein [Stygiolobus caldivivus]|uniref:Uncharacterized protein n=1 Tax=Stygiolobus caldivivus TaxID=2824673 RepID=A0A8D5ZFD7_9CREN|nr:hypothetical protein [Stygiolobus caldivivus]BCU70198.1 hypothetical protein KN1_14950 [Stygiolobus caldivivus]